MNNSIYLKRKSKVFLEKGKNELTESYIFNLLKNIESLGYSLSTELIECVLSLSETKFKSFYKQLIHDLNEMKGNHVEYKPMYPNFPEQVIEASHEELYVNAYWHYIGDWLGTRFLPDYEIKPREKLKDEIKLEIIELGSKEEFNAIFTNLLSAKSSISEQDREDLEWFIKNYNTGIFKYVPNEIPLKENAAFFIASLLKNNLEAEEQIKLHIKTATDVLRLAVALSDGDISLAENAKFISFSKKTRRLILQTLEDIGVITEDMLRYKNRWKRLGERLHPFEYKNRYPKCFEAFDIIRNNKPFETFNSKIEKALVAKDIESARSLLKTRPGEYARRLDHLIRLSDDANLILEDFKALAKQVSNPVLLQLRTHFLERNTQKDYRVFFPKGDIGKVHAIDWNLPEIEEEICQKIVQICEQSLIEKFAKYESLGKVYLDERLKDYSIPFGLRSASKALKTIPKGSRIDLPEGNILRFFMYWKDGSSRTDLDLSALALDTNNGYKMTIAYYNLKEETAYHSGDITSAPDGASEFIDIDIAKCLEQDIRYIMMSLNSYTKQAYSDLPICFAGFMMRQEANSGEVFEAQTVKNKFDITANTRIAIPMIFDLVERKIIWTDLALKDNPSTNNNVHNNLSSMALINEAMTNLVRPNLYDLFSLHMQARGEETLDISEANTIFAVDKGIKASDIEIILSEYL